MMDGVNEGTFRGGIPGKEQGLSLKDYYLTKSQVIRRYRSNRLMEEYDENLLGGLQHDIDEMRQILNCLRLPWMKLADAFFQGYAESPLPGKKERLLASRFIELMVKLSGEVTFAEKLMEYGNSQIKEIKELLLTCKEKAYYSIMVDDGLLYDLSLRQLVGIHDTIEAFLEHGNSSFHEFEDDDLYSVDMTMSVFRFVGDDSYSVSYDMDACEEEMGFTSSGQMGYVIEQMQQFLDKIEEGSSVDAVEEVPEEISVVIKEDHTPRERVLRETPFVNKYVRQGDDEALVTDFTIGANGLYLHDLSASQLKCVTRKLESFLDTVDEKWRELGTSMKQLDEEGESE
ncbi:hypothetical protein [Butyricimonas paravirosa]|uniref:hypothetical protein n=1 Tax=Butyricimonas paravirosa TaxID=1472417 RepID=UPI00210B1714|nr:hypothetical protein [Butyricimonas paravirosa]MCQ4874487.1 hypothetical protein [Butyricimonas paravirosa]